MTQERDLLCALLVRQLGFVTSEAMTESALELARNRSSEPLEGLLLRRGLLTAEQREGVGRMIDRILETKGGDGRSAFEALPSTAQETARAILDLTPPAVPDGETATQRTEAGRRTLASVEEAVCRMEPGRYEAISGADGREVVLGRGSGGTVHLMRDGVLGREIALKVFEPSDATPEGGLASVGARARFLREARLTGQLEHPAIVPVFEVGRRPDGRPYYTMKRIRGETLAAALEKASNLEERLRLLPSFLAACEGLAHAHSLGVVHRDVSPQNILLGPFGQVCVVDWGLARKRAAEDPRARELHLAPDVTGMLELELGPAGTPAYMSPERAHGSALAVDERSDVFSLGAILHQILTGRPPFGDGPPEAVLARLRTERVPTLRAPGERLPQELVTVCRKALRREPEGRYPTAASLAEELDAWLKGRRVAAHRYSLVEVARRVVRKQRFILTTVGALLVATALGGSVGLWRASQERDRARHFADLFLGDVTEALSPMPRVQHLVEATAARALAHYERTGALRSGSIERRLRVATAFVRLGRVQRELERTEHAPATLAYALELARELAVEAPEDPRTLALLSTALYESALQLRDSGRATEKRARLEEAKRWAEEALRAGPEHPAARRADTEAAEAIRILPAPAAPPP